MPTITPNLGLKKPLGNEIVSRQAYNENLDLLDQNAAKRAEIDAHVAETMPHRFTDTDTSKTYRWGMKAVNGVAVLMYEEVV